MTSQHWNIHASTSQILLWSAPPWRASPVRQLGPPPQLKGTATSSPAQGPTPCPNPLRQAEAGKRRVSFFLSVGAQRKKALAQGAVARHDQVQVAMEGANSFFIGELPGRSTVRGCLLVGTAPRARLNNGHPDAPQRAENTYYHGQRGRVRRAAHAAAGRV